MAVVVNTGFAETAKLICGTIGGSAFTHIALGTDSQTEGTALTGLSAEVSTAGLGRAAADTAVATATANGDTAVFSYTWTATGTADITECGVFNSSAAGVMLCYGTFADAIPMSSDDTLKVTWSVTVRAP